MPDDEAVCLFCSQPAVDYGPFEGPERLLCAACWLDFDERDDAAITMAGGIALSTDKEIPHEEA